MFEGVGGCGGGGGWGKRVFNSFRSPRCRGLLYALVYIPGIVFVLLCLFYFFLGTLGSYGGDDVGMYTAVVDTASTRQTTIDSNAPPYPSSNE